MATIADLVIALGLNTANFDRGIGTATRGLSMFTRNVAGLGAIGGVGAALGAAAAAASKFGHQMAEIATLLPDGVSQVGDLREEISKLSREFGKTPAEQAEALYQIISAGASDAKTATELLTVANKLATGGVTTVAIAADGLTSVMAAYGDRVRDATEVSDAFFVASAAGKTTIEELSHHIGNVAPLAAQMGVSLAEVTSAVGALTKGGQTTAISIRGVRAILAEVAKPSSQAATEAKRLGLEFNSAALQSKGLAKFLQDVTEKTKGNVDSLALLFGGVESLVPVLALTGNSAKDFADTLQLTADSAGRTERAVATIDLLSPQKKFDMLKATIVDMSIQVGDKLLKVLVPAAQALTTWLQTLGGQFDEVTKGFKGMAAELDRLDASQRLTGVGIEAGRVWDWLASKIFSARHQLLEFNRENEAQRDSLSGGAGAFAFASPPGGVITPPKPPPAPDDPVARAEEFKKMLNLVNTEVSNINANFGFLAEGQKGLNGLGARWLELHSRISGLLAAQKDQLGDTATQLRQMLADLDSFGAGAGRIANRIAAQTVPKGLEGMGAALDPDQLVRDIQYAVIKFHHTLTPLQQAAAKVEAAQLAMAARMEDFSNRVMPALGNAIGNAITAFLQARGAFGKGGAAGFGSQIGSILGASSASLFGGSLGKFAGTAFGGPIVGAVLGGLGGIIGGAIGGLFGKHKKPVDESANALNRLKDAADKVSESLTNVPNIFKIAAARFDADNPLGPPTGPTSGGPPVAGGGTGAGGGPPQPFGNVIIGTLNVDAAARPIAEVLDEVLDLAQQRSRNVHGDSVSANILQLRQGR